MDPDSDPQSDPDSDPFLVDVQDLHVLYEVMKAPGFEYVPSAPAEGAAIARVCIWKEDMDLLERFVSLVDCSLVLPRVIRTLYVPELEAAVPAVHAVAMRGQLTPAFRREHRRLTLAYLLEYGTWDQVAEVFERFQAAYDDTYPWSDMLLAEAVRRVKPEAVQALLAARASKSTSRTSDRPRFGHNVVARVQDFVDQLPSDRLAEFVGAQCCLEYLLDDESLCCYELPRNRHGGRGTPQDIRIAHFRVLQMVLSDPGLPVSDDWCEAQSATLDRIFAYGSDSDSESDPEREHAAVSASRTPRELLQMRVTRAGRARRA